MVASHTEKPLGCAKWLGKATPHKYNLADMQGTRANHVAYPRAGLYYWGQSHTSHFEKPKGFSVWLATFVRCRWHLSLLHNNARIAGIIIAE